MEKQFLSVGIKTCDSDKQRDVGRHKFTMCDQNGSFAAEYSYFSALTNGHEFGCACCKRYYAEFIGVVNLPDYDSPLMGTFCYKCFCDLQGQFESGLTQEGVDAAELFFQFGFTFDDTGRRMLSHDVKIRRPSGRGKIYRNKLQRLVGDLM